MQKIDKSKAVVTCNYETMTSLEVAELVGMQHSHLLRDIRKMESGWIKAQDADNQQQSKFGLLFRENKVGNGAVKKEPYYVLNRIQWLYVATKFNDEARAKLVLRWEKLEKERQQYTFEREISKMVRRTLTDAIKESGENERMHGHAYSTYTNKIYRALFGMDAKKLRKGLNLAEDANLRECLPEKAIKRIAALESIAQRMVEMGGEYKIVCEEIDNIVRKQKLGMGMPQLKDGKDGN